MDIKRTQQEIILLAGIIKNEADNLPEVNNFSEDNDEIIEEGFEVARQLYAAAGGHYGEVEHEYVKDWLEGRKSDLDDYSN